MPKTISSKIHFGKYNDFMVDDEATIYMQYENQMTAVFIITTGEAVSEERLEIVGTKGKLLLEDNHLKIWRYEKDIEEYSKTATVTDSKELKIELTKEEFEVEPEPFTQMLQNFTDVILNNDEIVVHGEEGSYALEPYLSAWKNQTIQLPISAQEYEEQLLLKIKEESLSL